MSVIAIGGVQEVGTHALVTGATYGSIFTLVATGTVGQSAIIQGSIDQEHWVDIVTFSIDPNEKALSAVLQFTYKYLQITGDAKSKNSKRVCLMGIIIHQDGLLWSGNGGTGNGIPTSEKGQPDGVATLDGEGRVPLGQLPDVTGGITLIQAQEEISSNIKINKSGYINPTANGINAVAIGSGSTSNGTNSFAVNGGYAVRNAIAIGTNTTTGTEAIALGINCNATASSSIAIGSNTQSLGINSLSIGITARASNSSAINYGVAIGYNCSTTGSYQIQVGGTAQTVYAYGAIQDRSDSRDKADIQACDLGLDFINALQPKKYKWDYREDYAKDKFPHLEREHFDSDDSYQAAIEQQYQARCAFFQDPVKDGSKIRSRYHYGLIADDLKSTLEQLDIDFGGYQDHSINGGMCVKSIGYIELLAPLIKAVQELSAKVAALETSPH